MTQFHIVYAAASDWLFRPSERVLQQIRAELNRAANGRAIVPQTKRMLDHLEARSLYEAQQFESFDRAKLFQLRKDREEFGGPKYDALYQGWKTDGEAAIVGAPSPKYRDQGGVKGTFSTHLFKQNYDIFDTPPRASDGV